MTMENQLGFTPDPRDIAEDAETLKGRHVCTPECDEDMDEVWGPLPCTWCLEADCRGGCLL